MKAKNSNARLLATLILYLLLAQTAGADELKGDARAGKSKAAACVYCHVVTTAGSEPAPALTGQNAGYLRDAMQAYKKGDRQHAVMRALMQPISRQDMVDMASYWSQRKTTPSKPRPKQPGADSLATIALGEQLVSMNNCVSCHGEGLSAPADDDIPKLSDLLPAYLENAMRSYIPTAGQEQGSRRNAMMRYALNITDPKTGKERFFNHQELRAMAVYISTMQSLPLVIPAKAEIQKIKN